MTLGFTRYKSSGDAPFLEAMIAEDAHRGLAVHGRPVVEDGEEDLDAVRLAPLHYLLQPEHEVPVVRPCQSRVSSAV